MARQPRSFLLFKRWASGPQGTRNAVAHGLRAINKRNGSTPEGAPVSGCLERKSTFLKGRHKGTDAFPTSPPHEHQTHGNTRHSSQNCHDGTNADLSLQRSNNRLKIGKGHNITTSLGSFLPSINFWVRGVDSNHCFRAENPANCPYSTPQDGR